MREDQRTGGGKKRVAHAKVYVAADLLRERTWRNRPTASV
jgi:hypothetical protein